MLARSIVFVLLMVYQAVSVAEQNTHAYSLENGLKIIVRVDKRAPVVVNQVWYKVGASYEHRGITGISHALEHMMFRGTEKYGSNQIAKIVAEKGGRQNAFTGYDYTVYFQEMDKQFLPLIFDVESDRMKNLILSEDVFTKEKEVIKEERRLRTEDRPESKAYEQFLAAAFLSSPYQNPIIGWMDDIDGLSVRALKDWYTRWYAPNNAVLVVIGDVEPIEVFDLAKQYFGGIQASSIPEMNAMKSIQTHGEHRIQVNIPGSVPTLYMGFQAPVVHTAEEEYEPYALELLAGILGQGDSARFMKDLVRGKTVAASAGAHYDAHQLHSTLFVIYGSPTPNHSLEALESSVQGEIEKLHQTLVSEEELNRIKMKIIAQHLYSQDSMFHQGLILGGLEAAGYPWEDDELYISRIQSITPEQVQRVAKRYLMPEQVTVTQLLSPVKEVAHPVQNDMGV